MTTSVPAHASPTRLLEPPQGVNANLRDPQSRAYYVYYTSAICIPIILLTMTIRCYGKLHILKKTWDDLACLLSMLAGLVYISLGVALVGSRSAFGIHQYELTSLDVTTPLLRLSMVHQAIYGPLVWLVKLSLFIMYFEIFGRLRWMRLGVYIGAISTGIFYLSSVVVYLVPCSPNQTRTPVEYLNAWKSDKCRRFASFLVAIGTVNVASDLYLMLLPLPAVWSLQLPKRRKVAISLVFLTGAVACVACIVGFYYRLEYFLHRNHDLTWMSVQTIIITDIELTAGIVVACMPTAAVVLNHAKPSIQSLLSSSKSFLRSFTKSKSPSSTKTKVQVKLGKGAIDYNKPLPLPPNARYLGADPRFRELDTTHGLKRTPCVGLNYVWLENHLDVDPERCYCGAPPGLG